MGLDVRKTVPAVTHTHNALVGSLYFCFEVILNCPTAWIKYTAITKKYIQSVHVFINVNVITQYFIGGKMTPKKRKNRGHQIFF